MRGFVRSLLNAIPPVGRGLRDLRDWRTMASLKRTQSKWGFTLWGGNYLVSGIQESEELDLLASQLTSADVLVDCGANAGLFTCLAASQGVPVIAVEPSVRNLAVLYRNIQENGFRVPIEIYPVALSDQPGIASLFGRGQGASLVAGWGDLPTYDSNTVPVLTLDGVLGQRFDGKRIVIKIDVEGGEWNVLKGATHTLQQRPRLLMELSLFKNHPDGRHPHFRQILDLFWGMKYRISDPAGNRAEITPSRVDGWYAAGATDLAGENIWLTPS